MYNISIKSNYKCIVYALEIFFCTKYNTHYYVIYIYIYIYMSCICHAYVYDTTLLKRISRNVM